VTIHKLMKAPVVLMPQCCTA